MRITSATLRNYRVHRELSVTFDPGITLISGPNESGKSTLVEAIHRALFLRARITGRLADEMRPAQGGIPSVELRLDLDGTEAVLTKTFHGPRGSATLELAGQPALRDDEAEEALARLLLVSGTLDGRGAAGQLPLRWAHLWTWQGQAGHSPLAAVGEQRDALVQRLQREGGAGVLQSAFDSRVQRAIRDERDALFTDRGDPRKNTDLARAEADLQRAQTDLQAAEEVLAKLAEALTCRAQAAQTLEDKGRTLETAERDRADTSRKLEEAEALQRALEPIRRRRDEADAGLLELDRVARDLATARQDRDEALRDLRPCEEKLESLRQEQTVLRAAWDDAEKTRDAARAAAAAARTWRSALEAQLQTHTARERLDALRETRATIVARREEEAALRAELARTPTITQKDLERLRKGQQDLAAAKAAHDALGARIEVLAATTTVRFEGRELAVGDSAVLTQDGEIAIGDVATLRIRPGGSTDITETRAAMQRAAGDLAERLARLGVSDLEAAVAACEKRRDGQDRLKAIQADLERLKADELEKALSAAEDAHAEAQGKAERAAAVCGRDLPPDVSAVRSMLQAGEDDSRRAEQAESAADAAARAARERADSAAASCATASTRAEALRRREQEAAVRIRTIEEERGTDAVRAQRAIALRAQREQTAAELEQRQRQLDELQPEQLRRDVTRFEQVIRQARDAIQTATKDRATADERLRLSGASDPQAERALRAAEVERMRSRRDDLRSHAEAIRLLASVADEVLRAMGDRLNRPLEAAAQGYLECVFGRGARMTLRGELQDPANEPALEVVREGAGLGTFPFEALSGGTREQIGIALRLALAEVLAADHGGALPIVLDDAFAYTDPARVRTVQRMLYRAAERGLQVIVLTCNPNDYGTLGAREFTLPTPLREGGATAPSITPAAGSLTA